MTKRSQFERRQRAGETARIAEIDQAWRARIPADVATAFEAQVRAARAREPRPAPAGQAPGTRPNPPRPGREPKPPKAETGRGRQR